MCTVDPEGKWKWYLKCEYGVLTVVSYLQLGFSLGAVQARRGMVSMRLTTREVQRWLVGGCNAENMWIYEGVSVPLSANRCADDIAAAVNDRGEVVGGGGGGRGEAAEYEKKMQTLLIRQLLAEHDALVAITHSEAVDVKLLNLLEKQDRAVRARRALRASLEVALVSREEWVNEESLFLLSETDSTYARRVAEGKPVRVTYEKAVQLTHILSDALAWESFLVYRSQRCSCGRSHAGNGSNPLEVVGSRDRSIVLTSTTAASSASERTPERKDQTRLIAEGRAAHSPNNNDSGDTTAIVKHRGVPTVTHPDCVALMMGNSVEYNPIWLAVARSGTTKTFLSELYKAPAWRSTSDVAEEDSCDYGHGRNEEEATLLGDGDVNHGSQQQQQQQQTPPPAEYYPCTTALLNTNITTNEMMYHAIDCAGASILIMDAQFIPLLFTTTTTTSVDTKENEGHLTRPDSSSPSSCEAAAAALTVRVPPCVHRIFVWRDTVKKTDHERQQKRQDSGRATSLIAPMRAALDSFNQRMYDRLWSCEVGRWVDVVSAGPPPLDLYDLVKDLYEPQQLCSTSAASHASATTSDGRGDEEGFMEGYEAHAWLLERIAQHSPKWLRSSSSNGGDGKAVVRYLSSLAEFYNPDCSSHLTAGEDKDGGGGGGGDSSAHQNAGHGSDTCINTGGSARKVIRSGKTRRLVKELEGKLRREQARQYGRLSAALCCFRHVQPVLFIYTSGTTGLPKAAKFSHLRFFATAFLSKVLDMRGKTAATLAVQKREREDTAATIAAAEASASAASTASPSSPWPSLSPDAERDSSGRCRRPKTAMDVILLIIWAILVSIARFLLRLIGLGRKFLYSPADIQLERDLSVVTVYNCLPMYHTVGCVFCLGHMMHSMEEQQKRQAEQEGKEPFYRNNKVHLAVMPVPSVRMVLRSRFSASKFRDDLECYHVTVVQYIGEIMRYAVLYERGHPHVRLAQGHVEQKNCEEEERQQQQQRGDGGFGKSNGHQPHSRSSQHVRDTLAAERATLLRANQTSWRVPYIFGNGLRFDIWQECKERLNIAHPVEFYSSTEGNIFLFNLFDIPGVIGHIPRFPGPINFLNMHYFFIFPFRVLKFDEDTQSVWRNPKNGFCARVGVGEVGEAVGEIIQGFDMFALRRFDGYHNSRHSTTADDRCEGGSSSGTGATDDGHLRPMDDTEGEKKMIRHVLWPHSEDAFFLSGDLIKFDDSGFCYFVDRIGDTFRWKGENVSTLEVSNALNTIHTSRVGVREAVVYGVSVGGREGRAGMALLTLQRRRQSHQGHSQSEEKRCSGDDGSGMVERDEHKTAAAAAVPACPLEEVHDDPKSNTTAAAAVTLDEEIDFLQNELFSFLCGDTRMNGDGTPNHAALPAYAIPVFIRMNIVATSLEEDVEEAENNNDDDDDDAGKEERNKKHACDGLACDSHHAASLHSNPSKIHHQGDSGTRARKAKAKDELQTSTFKYKRATLIKEGYAAAVTDKKKEELAGGQNNCASVPGTVSERIYVLVTKPAVLEQLCRVPVQRAECRGGYVPLDAQSLAVVGDHFENCGW